MILESYSVLFCGIGGQGILKASEISSVAAMKAGFHVKKSEVHGMSQRGGSVDSHLRFGKKIESPLIKPAGADFLVCFDEVEGERNFFYLKQNGIDFRSYLKSAQEKNIDLRFLNTFLIGILSAYLPISEKIWIESLREVMTRSVETNEQIFLNARKLGNCNV